MGVGHHLVRLVLRAVVAAPHLGVAQEEQLLGAQTQAGNRPRVAKVRVIPEKGCEGCLQPSVVCNIFSKRGSKERCLKTRRSTYTLRLSSEECSEF